jgi:hypothetical protein
MISEFSVLAHDLRLSEFDVPSSDNEIRSLLRQKYWFQESEILEKIPTQMIQMIEEFFPIYQREVPLERVPYLLL